METERVVEHAARCAEEADDASRQEAARSAEAMLELEHKNAQLRRMLRNVTPLATMHDEVVPDEAAGALRERLGKVRELMREVDEGEEGAEAESTEEVDALMQRGAFGARARRR